MSGRQYLVDRSEIDRECFHCKNYYPTSQMVTVTGGNVLSNPVMQWRCLRCNKGMKCYGVHWKKQLLTEYEL